MPYVSVGICDRTMSSHGVCWWQVIMKDKWMNIGYEDDELKPYQEPSRDCTDPVRIGLCHRIVSLQQIMEYFAISCVC